jgi:DNA-binding MarR family transcriptional regulator
MNSDPCLCTSLRQAALAATKFYDDALQSTGLKITMFRLLRRIGESGAPTMTRLAEIVQLDRSTLGRNLRVLERLGLVRLSEGEDERTKTIELTSAGLKKLEAALPLWASAQRRMKKRLGDHQGMVVEIVAKLHRGEAIDAG